MILLNSWCGVEVVDVNWQPDLVEGTWSSANNSEHDE